MTTFRFKTQIIGQKRLSDVLWIIILITVCHMHVDYHTDYVCHMYVVYHTDYVCHIICM